MKAVRYYLTHGLFQSSLQLTTPSFIHSPPGRGCPDDSNLPYVFLDFNGVAKSFVSTVHMIDGPEDPSCFSKVG